MRSNLGFYYIFANYSDAKIRTNVQRWGLAYHQHHCLELLSGYIRFFIALALAPGSQEAELNS